MNKKIKISFARRKSIVARLYIAFMLFFMASGCGMYIHDDENGFDPLHPNSSYGDVSMPFYYYWDEKFFLRTVTDHIAVVFDKDADTEQLHAIIRSSSLQPTDVRLEENISHRYAILKARNRNVIPPAVEYFKERDEVVSISYLYRGYDSHPARPALNGYFFVELKETTPFELLEELAEQNNCMIMGKLSLWSDSDEFSLFVPKTSKLNAMQMANLFYETGLFEYACPNFMFALTPDFVP